MARSSRQGRREQWDTLEYLADKGVWCDLHDPQGSLSRLPWGMSKQDQNRMAAVMERAKLMALTPVARCERARARL